MPDVPNTERRLKLSAVIPAYNEAECIGACVDEVRSVLLAMGEPFEIIIVDDGSIDGTQEALREKKSEAPELVVLRFAANSGQTAAFDAGFRAARGEVIVTLDADLQNDPADIPNLVGLVGEFDCVCGYRAERHDSAVRRVSSRVANAVRNRLTGESIRDVGCSLRAFRTECARGLKLFEGMHRFLPTLIRWGGWTITEVPVGHRPRTRGKSKYGIRNRVFRALADLWAVRWMQRRAIRCEVDEEIP